MARKPIKELRCAIYTRKSTEHGLDLEFNSLDAQREACTAYIKSQASGGWKHVSKRYDDPAYSGGNLERPALQRLLKDIEAGLVDVVVVYKIDRLTRSLADFAKLVEVFDARGISFVAVTQQFNTTTSMGRLTLNVLLSFAQFERELASERVRDKVAASRKKGKWTGGSVPLGYDSKDKKLVINAQGAKTVRFIFNRYLVLKSFKTLIAELDAKGIVSKVRPVNGKTIGGVPFTYGPLAYLLHNRTYIGETGHDGRWFKGEHEPILDRALFDKVQLILNGNRVNRPKISANSNALLKGLLYDDRGNAMSPSFTTKDGIRYPSYVSSAVLRGRKHEAGTTSRVPVREIETAVLAALRDNAVEIDEDGTNTPDELVARHLAKVTIHSNRLVIKLKNSAKSLQLPWEPARHRDLAKIEEPESASDQRKPNPSLVQSVVRAHIWLKALRSGKYKSIEALAAAAKIHPKVVRSRIRLALLAPDITRQILTGTQPASIIINELTECTRLSWRDQYSSPQLRAGM
jgi:DNA invertase Pin-like site-specific DNA recombinase